MNIDKLKAKVGKAEAKACSLAAAATVTFTAMTPGVAFADQTYTQAINTIRDTVNGFFNTIGYAIVALTAGLAFVALAKEILPTLFARDKPEFNARVKGAIVVVAACLIAGFLPMIINSIAALAGQGVDLGTV